MPRFLKPQLFSCGGSVQITRINDYIVEAALFHRPDHFLVLPSNISTITSYQIDVMFSVFAYCWNVGYWFYIITFYTNDVIFVCILLKVLLSLLWKSSSSVRLLYVILRSGRIGCDQRVLAGLFLCKIFILWYVCIIPCGLYPYQGYSSISISLTFP